MKKENEKITNEEENEDCAIGELFANLFNKLFKKMGKSAREKITNDYLKSNVSNIELLFDAVKDIRERQNEFGEEDYKNWIKAFCYFEAELHDFCGEIVMNDLGE